MIGKVKVMQDKFLNFLVLRDFRNLTLLLHDLVENWQRINWPYKTKNNPICCTNNIWRAKSKNTGNNLENSK